MVGFRAARKVNLAVVANKDLKQLTVLLMPYYNLCVNSERKVKLLGKILTKLDHDVTPELANVLSVLAVRTDQEALEALKLVLIIGANVDKVIMDILENFYTMFYIMEV